MKVKQLTVLIAFEQFKYGVYPQLLKNSQLMYEILLLLFQQTLERNAVQFQLYCPKSSLQLSRQHFTHKQVIAYWEDFGFRNLIMLSSCCCSLKRFAEPLSLLLEIFI